MALINSIVEGVLDEAMAARLIEAAGHTHGFCYGKKGSAYIKAKIAKYNQSATSIRYLVLVDFMDTRLPCPGHVSRIWIPNRKPNLIFRVVVREIESWVMADSKNFAEFLHIAQSKVPQNPEQLSDPKQTLINLARSSRRKQIRESLVPETNSTAKIGKLYNSEISQFIANQWDLTKALRNAPSLEKCYQRLQAIR
jgi:hypothetical protein